MPLGWDMRVSSCLQAANLALEDGPRRLRSDRRGRRAPSPRAAHPVSGEPQRSEPEVEILAPRPGLRGSAVGAAPEGVDAKPDGTPPSPCVPCTANMSRLHASLLIIIVCFALFRLSPRAQMYDSRFTLTASELLLTRGTLGFDVVPSRFDSGPAASVPSTVAPAPLPYQFEERQGVARYAFPVGTPLLALPYVALTRSLGWPVVDAEGQSHRDRERRLQRVLAALLMAGFCALAYATARLWLAPLASALVTLATATATPVWSTASRSLWSHTFAIVLLGVALFLLCRARRSERPPPIATIASLLAWASITRPTLAVAGVVVALLVFATRPKRESQKLVAVGAAWAAAFAVFSLWQYGTFLPGYYLAGRLSGAHWLVISAFPHWWGGWCYGPRLMTDTVPWWVLLGALGLAARLRTPEARLRTLPRAELGLAAGLLAIGMLLHGIGAISKDAARWNRHQDEPGFAARLWDWSEPQWLAWREGGGDGQSEGSP